MQATTSSHSTQARHSNESTSKPEPVLPTGSIFDAAGVVPTLYRDVLITRWRSQVQSAGDELLAGPPPKLPTNAVVQTPPPPARVREMVYTVNTPIFAATLRLSA